MSEEPTMGVLEYIEFLRAQVKRLQEALDASHPHLEPKPGCKACEILNAP